MSPNRKSIIMGVSQPDEIFQIWEIITHLNHVDCSPSKR